jgi:hypothetical protein
MKRAAVMRECRRPTFQSWVGAALVFLLLLAEAFAVTHPFDAAAHADGQPCTVCLSTTAFGAGAIAAPLELDLDAAAPVFVAIAIAVFVSVAPTRRYARGPPTVPFAL